MMLKQNKKVKNYFLLNILLTSLFFSSYSYSQDNLDLEDPDDFKFLLEDFGEESEITSDSSDSSDNKESQIDLFEDDTSDLEALKMDLGDIEFLLPEEIEEEKRIIEANEKKLKTTSKPKAAKKTFKGKKPTIVNKDDATSNIKIFEVGEIERELLRVAEKMQGIIPDAEWNEIAKNTISSTYTVVRGDWLWKISQRLFGSGFYYSKIWSLNPYITNPHLIEPGMLLIFSLGTEDELPDLKVGSFSKNDMDKGVGANNDMVYNDPSKNMLNRVDTNEAWGDDAIPGWIKEREELIQDGVYLQFATDATLEDLKSAEEVALIKEYENYDPPSPDFEIKVPEDEYDETGFSKESKLVFDYKQGFYLNTFVSSNIAQDFGFIDKGIDEGAFFQRFDQIFVKFDENLNLVPGDIFSVYVSGGKVSHPNSERKGTKISITGHIKLINQEKNLWRCEITETPGLVQRGDRITVFTPKISQITTTFNPQRIEATIVGVYHKGKSLISYGDVVYLDRGRADGVEMGNVFQTFDFKDRRTKQFITGDPVYKTGELTVISLTDNFATVLVTSTIKDFYLGDLAITKDIETAARVSKINKLNKSGVSQKIATDSLDELDVELNLDNLNDKLLNEADKIQFTEDELAELERQEREKSIMDENERDLRALERLEKEIETAEQMLREARLDEDKLMENQDLDNTEKTFGLRMQESLDEIEENFGKRYMDEDINDKENPYGLTEFDIEEIDELLNVDQGTVEMKTIEKAQIEGKEVEKSLEDELDMLDEL